MPRITKGTVEEHREAQLSALLIAARTLVLEEGVNALTFAALARRTELARPTLYEYFGNRGDLIIALVHAEASGLVDRVRQAVRQETDPLECIDAFVRTQLELVAHGSHDALFLLMGASSEPEVHDYAQRQHRQLAELIAGPLRAAGVARVEWVQVLLAGTVEKAAMQLRDTTDGSLRGDLIRTAVRFSRGAVESLGRDG